MATGKRFYWMKLKESFMTSDTIDYFMSQPNGAQYVVLYQMLCLKTINTDGKLERQIGEVIIPYDIGKIQRDTKWFSEDTIRVALQLYKSFGLIYEDQNGTLVMADHENLVGSETDYAEKNRRIRNKLSSGRLTDGHNVSSNVSENVTTEIRDRDIDIETTTTPTPSPSSGFEIDPEEARKTQEDHNEILDAAEDAGFPKNKGTWDMLIDLYAEHGKDAVLAGIKACVEQGVPKISYLKGCIRKNAEGETKPKEDPLLPRDHVFMGW